MESITFKEGTNPHIAHLAGRIQSVYKGYNREMFKAQNFRFRQPQEQGKQAWFKAIFEHMESWSDRRFILPMEVIHIGFHEIGHISFMNLKELKINKVEICTIEALAWLDAPFVREIEISENHITLLKSFAKSNFQELDCLDYELNKSNQNQFKHLARANMKQNFRRLSVDGNKDTYIDLNVTWMGSAFKLPISEFEYLILGFEDDSQEDLAYDFENRFYVETLKIEKFETEE